MFVAKTGGFMKTACMYVALIFLGLSSSCTTHREINPGKPHTILEIEISSRLPLENDGLLFMGPFSGRLVVNLGPSDPAITEKISSQGGTSLPLQDMDTRIRALNAATEFALASRRPGTGRFIAAIDVANVSRGDIIEFDADLLAAPYGFSSLPAGDYTISVTLDTDSNLAYTGSRGAGDLFSRPVRITLPAERPRLVISGLSGPRTPWPGLDNLSQSARPAPAMIELRSHTRDINFTSRSLSAFFSKETRIRGWVLLPPGYDDTLETYPTVYEFAGFGADLNTLAQKTLLERYASMYGKLPSGERGPSMIWVFLDQSWVSGSHEFADSENNGPWATALTSELIPWLESQFRMDAKPSGRLLAGHSSGGWTALWLQVKYPRLFGGAWAQAPDPVDFRNFTNTNIYEAGANVFYANDGSEKPLVRDDGQITSFKAMSDFERVQGRIGGQLSSFEWVFSPKGRDGMPKPLFDRKTGDVDPQVAAHWRNYDISNIIVANWPALKADLDGKIHLTVGTSDTYYLNLSAELLEQRLIALGGLAEFHFLEGRNHSNLGVQGTDALEMFRTARPDADIGIQGGITKSPAR